LSPHIKALLGLKIIQQAAARIARQSGNPAPAERPSRTAPPDRKPFPFKAINVPVECVVQPFDFTSTIKDIA
jgi:hypothetical protein